MKKQMDQRHPRVRFGRVVGSVAAAVAVSSCLAAGVAFADELTDAEEALSGTPVYLQSGLFSDQETSSTASVLSNSAGFPSTLDLRHYNGTVTYDAKLGKSVITGGINYVTPVKLQNPFGSCWAFSICASAETSLLTSLDKADDGELNGTVDYEKAAAGEAGDVAYNASDLSERALAYSVYTYPKTYGMYNSQAGEGMYLASGVMSDGAKILNTGGLPFSGVSTFSCGIGPVPEKYAPYISDEGWIQVPTPQVDSEGYLTYTYFTDLTAATAYWNETWTDEVITNFNKENGTAYTKNSVRPRRSSKGTWAVESENTYGTVAELTESKILEINKGDGLTDDEIASMKEELIEGRAISIAFCADQSRPGQAINANNSYLNTETWAQYTYEKKQVNHGVTIVGYDDDYAASNFTHNQYTQDPETGELVLDEERTAQTTPAGNGAWIVKNSWGSTNSGDLDYMDWGVDGSGYFYLSYYDKNISSMESYEFDTSTEAQERTEYATQQYDVSKANQTSSKGYDSATQTANVFDGPDAGESSVAIRDIGCLTGAVDDTVTLDIYVMSDSADPTTVITTSKPTLTVSEFYDKSGFHRIHLDDPVVLASDQKIAIVQTTKRVNGKYELTCLQGMNENFITSYNAAHTSTYATALPLGGAPSYVETVVNKGESLIYTDGAWSDWSIVRSGYGLDDTANLVQQVHAEAAQLRKYAEIYKLLDPTGTTYEYLLDVASKCEKFDIDQAYTYDNFSIKIYGDAVDDVTEVFPDVDSDAWYTASVQRVYELGLMTGYKDAEGNPTTFGTHDVLTRAQAVAVLYNLAGNGAEAEGGQFSDVADGAWYADAVNWAASEGIVSGYGDGTFAPDKQVTREQLAVMLYAMAQKGLIDVPTAVDANALDGFADKGSVSSWATESMQWAVTQGVISGAERDGARYLDPTNASERCVMAAMVSNILAKA